MSLPQRNAYPPPTSAAVRQHLRIHQPHDQPADVTIEAGDSQADSRHELADVVGKIACRLRQHVASATMHGGMLARQLGADSRNMAILEEVVRSVKALGSLVDGLSDYASDAPPQLETFAVDPLLDEVLGTVRDRCERQKVSVEKNIPAALCVEADRRQLAAALRHLTISALASMPEGGEMVLTVVAMPHGVEVEVGDSGPGLMGDELTDAFAPLRSQPAQASGLERAIAQHVALAHGGSASARNCPEGGAALTLFFPARRALTAVG